jgi:hypothetical protein
MENVNQLTYLTVFILNIKKHRCHIFKNLVRYLGTDHFTSSRYAYFPLSHSPGGKFTLTKNKIFYFLHEKSVMFHQILLKSLVENCKVSKFNDIFHLSECLTCEILEHTFTRCSKLNLMTFVPSTFL